MIVQLTVEDLNRRRSTLELDSADILTAAKVNGKTVITTSDTQQYTVLEELPDIEQQFDASGIAPPTGKERRFNQLGITAAMALVLDTNNITTLRAFADRALASDAALATVATALGLTRIQVVGYLMRAYGVNGYIPASVVLPAVVVQTKKG